MKQPLFFLLNYLRISVSLHVFLITLPDQKRTRTFGSRPFLVRVIHSFLFTTIISSLWDFRKFRKKENSIFKIILLLFKVINEF
jgi:hypothetical protein